MTESHGSNASKHITLDPDSEYRFEIPFEAAMDLVVRHPWPTGASGCLSIPPRVSSVVAPCSFCLFFIVAHKWHGRDIWMRACPQQGVYPHRCQICPLHIYRCCFPHDAKIACLEHIVPVRLRLLVLAISSSSQCQCCCWMQLRVYGQ